MAAANGAVKTILGLIVVILVMCLIGAYLFVVIGDSIRPDTLANRAPISMGTHDHRIDRWSHIDLA